ncbi:hypothetical protein KAU33_09295 [Candidatus Dependentiae bacterium]|nr:hypothetical protein [Candidatus Dependentiae bacterium]
MKKIYFEHVIVLLITFVVLDLTSTFIGLYFGLTEIGFYAKNFDFLGITIMKIIAFFVLLGLHLAMIKNSGYYVTTKAVYFIAGINGGIFIFNMHQIVYVLKN